MILLRVLKKCFRSELEMKRSRGSGFRGKYVIHAAR